VLACLLRICWSRFLAFLVRIPSSSCTKASFHSLTCFFLLFPSSPYIINIQVKLTSTFQPPKAKTLPGFSRDHLRFIRGQRYAPSSEVRGSSTTTNSSPVRSQHSHVWGKRGRIWGLWHAAAPATMGCWFHAAGIRGLVGGEGDLDFHLLPSLFLTDNNTPSVPQLHQHLLVSRILTPLHIPTRRPFSPVGTTAPSSSNQTNLHSTVLRNVSHRTKPHPLRPRANKVPTYRHPTTQILCNSSCSCCHERPVCLGIAR